MSRHAACSLAVDGLALLPAYLTIAMMSLVGSPILVIRYGLNRPLVIGMAATGVGLAFLAQAPVGENVVLNVLPNVAQRAPQRGALRLRRCVRSRFAIRT